MYIYACVCEQTGCSTQVVSRSVPLKTASAKGCVGQTATMRFPLLLPQDLWIAIWNSSSFSKHILRDLDVQHLVRFWREVGDHPALKFHPIKQMENFERRTVPLILHGDGAAVTQQIGAGTKSCLFLSCRSWVGHVNQHFLMASCWTHITAKGPTMHTSKSIVSILGKSFLEMQHEAGARSGDFVGIPVLTSCDLEYFNEFNCRGGMRTILAPFALSTKANSWTGNQQRKSSQIYGVFPVATIVHCLECWCLRKQSRRTGCIRSC